MSISIKNLHDKKILTIERKAKNKQVSLLKKFGGQNKEDYIQLFDIQTNANNKGFVKIVIKTDNLEATSTDNPEIFNLNATKSKDENKTLFKLQYQRGNFNKTEYSIHPKFNTDLAFTVIDFKLVLSKFIKSELQMFCLNREQPTIFKNHLSVLKEAADYNDTLVKVTTTDDKLNIQLIKPTAPKYGNIYFKHKIKSFKLKINVINYIAIGWCCENPVNKSGFVPNAVKSSFWMIYTTDATYLCHYYDKDSAYKAIHKHGRQELKVGDEISTWYDEYEQMLKFYLNDKEAGSLKLNNETFNKLYPAFLLHSRSATSLNNLDILSFEE